MRLIRLFLYFVFGVVLGGVSSFSFAETIPATPTICYKGGSSGCIVDTQQMIYHTVCVHWVHFCGEYGNPRWRIYQQPGRILVGRDGDAFGLGFYPQSSSSCPEGQGWLLENGQCTRPDCAAGQVRNDSGVCDCPSGKVLEGGSCKTVCPTGYHRHVPDDGQCEKDCTGRQVQKPDGTCGCNQESGTMAVPWSELSSKCVGGCATSFSGGIANPVDVAKYLVGDVKSSAVTAYAYVGFNGQACNSPNVKIPATAKFIPKDTTGTGADGALPDQKNTPGNNESPQACASAGGSYGVFNGVAKCLTGPVNSMDAPKKLDVKENITEKVNSDGSTVSVIEKEYRVYDPVTGRVITEKVTEEVVKDSSGKVTGGGSTNSKTDGGSGAGQGLGDGKGDGDQLGQCAKEPNSPICKIGTVSSKGQYGTEQEAQIVAAKSELRQKFAEIKTSATAMFSGSISGGAGSLPCYPPINILGSSMTLCFNKYESQLAVIGAFIMLMASLSSLFIVMRR